MIKAHQIKLTPTTAQEVFFRKSSGVARFAYNWALNKWQEDYKNGIKQSAYTLIKHLNSIKHTEFPWMQETGKTCSQYAIHNLESAYKKMWKEKRGYPKYKKKGNRDSFIAVENYQTFKQKNYKIWIPRLGWVRCGENLRFEGKVNYVRIKRIANMWFAIINIEIEDKLIETSTISKNQTIVGVDMGVKSMLVLNDGTIFENPKALMVNLKSLKRLQRGLSRKKKGSNNRHKQQVRIARKHYKIGCVRKNAIHHATSTIINKYDKIIIETLKPSNMIKNHNLAQVVSDVSFGEITRQLSYKAQWQGKELIKADQWFASSKICSFCGNKKDVLKLSERIYKCLSCGLEIDRDINAAKNLANYSPTLKHKGCEVCGEGSSALEQSPSKKQKIVIFNNKKL